MDATPMLDAAEYLHLAIHASQEGNHHSALSYLKQALENEPNNAAVRYFLAAEHAELGLLERARAEMIEVLTLEPSMDIARFQLGLLHLQLQSETDAKTTFVQLVELSQDASLVLFAQAYVDLLDENRIGAINNFKSGLVDCSNPALKADMSRVLASLDVPDQAIVQEETKSPVFLGAYRDSLETP
jgi:tetratricopeptide (TPR) repeat protein